METKDREYLDAFEQRVSQALVESCTADGQMIDVEELDGKWRTSAPEYMAAAVPQIADYPAAAVAWACYLGMGAAVLWDKSWGEYKDVDDWYALMASPRGFDCMDEYVTECLLGCKSGSGEAVKIEDTQGADRASERNGLPCLCPHDEGVLPARCLDSVAASGIPLCKGAHRLFGTRVVTVPVL